MTKRPLHKMLKYLPLLATLLLTLLSFGCEGDRGPAGANGSSFGTVTGEVTDTGGNRLAGITVAPTPAVAGVANASTDNNGNYSLSLPSGSFTLTYSRPGYATQTQSVNVIATQSTTVPVVALTQTAAAVVNVANARFGSDSSAVLTATALVNTPALQGQPVSFVWTDQAGNVIGSGSSVTVQQPAASGQIAAVAEFAKVRQSIYPPGHDPVADENDFDLPDFETLNRLQVLPISQQAFELGANTTFRVRGTIAFQTFSTTALVSVPTNRLPFVPNGGIRNVPVGQPVVIQGKVQGNSAAGDYNWTIDASGAPGSALTSLGDPTTRFPHFIPDVPGTYVITENKTATVRTITIYAGTYLGMLVPTSDDNPLGAVDTTCTNTNGACHPGGSAFFATPYNGGVQFFSTTPINTVFSQWSASGHRQIMVRGMQLGSSYSLNACAKCHSVGWTQYSSATRSFGFREVAAAVGFTDAAWRGNAPTFFKGFPQVLKLSEVQCETCHGPNSNAHATGVPDTIASRFSVASDVCGVCHGEPLRHGRYQEWRESGHGDFQTAMSRGLNANGIGPNPSCGGCHTGQGFPLFLSQLQGTNGNPVSPLRTLSAANIAALSFLTTDNVQPQTCAVCHQVHNPGQQSGLVGNIVILRGNYQPGGSFDGITPLLPAGFQANGVGKGALCITCHNSRNGGVAAQNTATLHEDGDPNFGALASYDAPHEACQGDVIMGRNAYFFSSPVAGEDLTLPGFPRTPQVGQRSRHSFLADVCVTCHVQRTPTDPTLGYPPGVAGAGTNHTFNIVTDKTRPAGDQINALCNQCHGPGFVGTGLQQSFDATYRQLLIAAGKAVLRLKFGSAGAIPAGTTITFIPGRAPQESQVSLNNGVPSNISAFLGFVAGTTTQSPGTPNTGPIPANGFQRDLAKANWNISLVAPRYNATQLDGSSYDDGTPILNSSGGAVEVAGDQSKGVHNPSFVFNVMGVTIARLNAL